ncbi:MAG: hypothetical protein QF849_15590 [Pseudomonadales bacterium]|nr:hypothetical protein [Pseudomonadales bacterium]
MRDIRPALYLSLHAMNQSNQIVFVHGSGTGFSISTQTISRRIGRKIELYNIRANITFTPFAIESSDPKDIKIILLNAPVFQVFWFYEQAFSDQKILWTKKHIFDIYFKNPWMQNGGI